MAERLTAAEKRCCHMSQWAPGANGTLASWRKEYREIPASEHCRDCPLKKSG